MKILEVVKMEIFLKPIFVIGKKQNNIHVLFYIVSLLNLFHLEQYCAINENKCGETVTTPPYIKMIPLYLTF